MEATESFASCLQSLRQDSGRDIAAGHHLNTSKLVLGGLQANQEAARGVEKTRTE